MSSDAARCYTNRTRQQQVDSNTFLVALEEEGSFVNYGTQGHTNFEKVGWIAFEPGKIHRDLLSRYSH